MDYPILRFNRLRNRRGQSALEAMVTFVVTILLLWGIIKIWFWANNQIVERQLKYNDTRVAAGTSLDSYKLVWPVYKPPELTQEEVIMERKQAE
jgi:hypothetical protein